MGKNDLFTNYSCPEHGTSIEELTPRMFSFNNPYGACPKCTGLGVFMSIDPDIVIPNKNLTIREGGIRASGWSYLDGGTIAQMYYEGLARHYGFSLDVPIYKLPSDVIDVILYGSKGEKIKMTRRNEYGSGTYMVEFEGIVNNLQRRYKETSSEWMREELESYMSQIPCPECGGKRLKPESLAVTVGGINIAEMSQFSVRDALDFINNIKLTERERMIGGRILKEITERLGFLQSVGLDYLSLSRSAGTLSGGESQRIRLATQIGSYLMGVLYILDEPSIGLHQRDNARLFATLRRLRDIGNTLIVVEHDEDTIRNADWVVDIGPGQASTAEGYFLRSVEKLCSCDNSVTGQYLSGKSGFPYLKNVAEETVRC